MENNSVMEKAINEILEAWDQNNPGVIRSKVRKEFFENVSDEDLNRFISKISKFFKDDELKTIKCNPELLKKIIVEAKNKKTNLDFFSNEPQENPQELTKDDIKIIKF